jgi:hypothetical protein
MGIPNTGVAGGGVPIKSAVVVLKVPFCAAPWGRTGILDGVI